MYSIPYHRSGSHITHNFAGVPHKHMSNKQSNHISYSYNYLGTRRGPRFCIAANMSGSPSRPTAVDLLALNDAQLREIMEQSRQPDGSYALLVTNDFGPWSQEERDGLDQRLKCVVLLPCHSFIYTFRFRAIQANSRPLTVDKLDALLQQVSNRDDGDDASCPSRRRRSESRVTGPLPDAR